MNLEGMFSERRPEKLKALSPRAIEYIDDARLILQLKEDKHNLENLNTYVRYAQDDAAEAIGAIRDGSEELAKSLRSGSIIRFELLGLSTETATSIVDAIFED